MSKILITGGSGLLGKAITQLLLDKGYEVAWLSRKAGNWNGVKKFYWHPGQSEIDIKAFDGVEHLIHLAGKGIVDKAWTKQYKRELLESRVKGLEFLNQTIIKNNFKIKTLVGAGASGFYGYTTNDEEFTENNKPGNDFISELCLAWENAYSPFASAGIRTIILRIGVVLSREGGFYAKLSPLYKMGLTSVFGDGKFYLSWIHIKDLSSMFVYCIENMECRGVYNASSEPLWYSDFSKQFALSLNRTLFISKLPKFLIRLFMGERAVLFTKGVRMGNEKIKSTGFKIKFDSLVEALKDLKA